MLKLALGLKHTRPYCRLNLYMTKTKLPTGLRSRLREFARYQHVTRSLQVQCAVRNGTRHKLQAACPSLQHGSDHFEQKVMLCRVRPST